MTQGEVMIRLIVIAVLIVLAYFLLRYRTNEKIQKGVVVTLLGLFAIYTLVLVATELFR
jgi:Ca2+/Na+ antiporter